VEIARAEEHIVLVVDDVLAGRYNSKNEKRVLNAFWTASQTHLKCISNASSERLLKAFLTAFEMRLKCDCGNAFYK